MWFKQMTCDCCYTPLASTGRHNRYYFCKILDFQKLTKFEYQKRYDYFNSPLDHRFNYDTSPYCLNGYVYSYKTEPLTPKNYSSWYCDSQCAIKEAIRSNALLFYYDESERSVAFFTPHTVEINRAIKESDNTPLLLMEWGEERWFQNKSKYKDLREFGFDNEFPQFTSKEINLIKPTDGLLPFHKKLILDPEFQKDYFGASGPAICEHVQNKFNSFIKSAEINFGRRLMIEWFITNNLKKYIGFIHITCMYPAFPYKWVVEFGMIKEYRRRGIMTAVLKAIVKWAKDNGCDEIYAISEEHNVASHHLLKSLPYNVVEKRVMMADQFAGDRPMRNYIVHL